MSQGNTVALNIPSEQGIGGIPGKATIIQNMKKIQNSFYSKMMQPPMSKIFYNLPMRY